MITPSRLARRKRPTRSQPSAFATADASRARSFADVAAQRVFACRPNERWPLNFAAARNSIVTLRPADLRSTIESSVRAPATLAPGILLRDIAELERELDTVNTRIAARTMPKQMSARAGQPPTDKSAAASCRYRARVVLAGVRIGLRLGSLAGPNSLDAFAISEAIADQAATFHRALTRLVDIPVERRLEGGRVLYDMILRPIEPSLSRAQLGSSFRTVPSNTCPSRRCECRTRGPPRLLQCNMMLR